GGRTLLAVWIEQHGGYNDMYYRLYQVGEWWPKTVVRFIFSRNNTSPQYPHLVADSKDKIHMIWMENGGGLRDIAYGTFTDGHWDTWTGTGPNDFIQVTPLQRDVWPRLAIDSANDKLHAIWSRHKTQTVTYDAEIFHAQKAQDGNWFVERVTYTNWTKLNYHADVTARNGQVVAIWEQHNVGIFSSHRLGAGEWSTPVQVGGGKWPAVANDSNGNVHALFGYGAVSYFRRTAAGSWSNMGVISTYARDKNHLDIRTDAYDNVYAVFQQGPEGPDTYNAGRLLMSTGDTKGNMKDPVVLWARDGGWVHSPVAAPDNNGSVHIVWHDAGVGYLNPPDEWLDWGHIYYVKAEGVMGRRVQVISPNGGEVWRIGEEHTLRWEVTVPEGETPPETVIVEYSLDGGSTWTMLYEEVPNRGYATAEIPRDVVQPSTQCRFRITDPDSGISDASDNNFTLLPPYAESGASFVKDGVWQTASQGLDGWYVGDYTGDGKDDIMNVTNLHQKVFASDGTQFIKLGSWIKALTGMYGWFPGDFNGDGKTDLLRYRVE
ncbi:MAG: hypothetical protein ACK2U9_21585, partial [Anaerolineae bacterium]